MSQVTKIEKRKQIDQVYQQLFRPSKPSFAELSTILTELGINPVKEVQPKTINPMLEYFFQNETWFKNSDENVLNIKFLKYIFLHEQFFFEIGYKKVDQPEIGDLVVYFNEEIQTPTNISRKISETRLESLFGDRIVVDHEIDNVPKSYGNRTHFYSNK